jgi:hypothetical protein
VYKKYLNYTVEEMLEDRDFPIWLKRLSENHELDKLVVENPQFALKVRHAREIIMLLGVKEEPVIQDDIFDMWGKIYQFDQIHQSKIRIRRSRQFLKYAAAILFMMMLTTAGYWKFKKEENFKWYAFKEGPTTGQSRLILSTGEEIDLKKDESSIKVNAQDHAIRVNNDRIIELSGDSNENPEIAMNQVVVPYGKKSFLELADGTKVWLNAGSKLAFPARFQGSKREVFLEGEAFFDVTPDQENPFYVRTKEVEIRVLGTRFNVSDYEADKEVMTVLIEGSVSLRENKGFNVLGKEVILKDHQRALFNKTDLTTIVNEEAQAENYTAWTEGWFPFYKEPLGNVFKKVERYYNVRFEYLDLFPSDDLISGKLDLKDSIEDVMKVLADVAKVNYRINQEKISIGKNNSMPMRN